MNLKNILIISCFFLFILVCASPTFAEPLVDAGPDQTANTGEEVALQGSFIDDSPTEAWGYEWDFGDGSNQRGTSYSTIPEVKHTYNEPGEYNSTLKVFNGHTEGWDSAKIVVSGTPIEHVAPVADFTATPLSGNLPLGVTFVSQSTGIITDYVWEVDPGFPATTTTDPFYTYTYTNPGTYTVKLTVNGPDGTDTKTKTEYITAGLVISNEPPVTEAGGPYYGKKDVPILFDASNSYDPNGESLLYRWDFNNDGTYDTTWTDDPQSEHTYTLNYVGQARLEVTDGQYSSTDLAEINPATHPIAMAGGKYTAIEGVPVIFDGSNSSDPNGDSLLYRWDFNNDGIYDTSWTDNPQTEHTYTDHYVGQVKLEVNDGLYSSTDQALVNMIPTVDAGSDQTVFEGQTITLQGTFTDTSDSDFWDYMWDLGDGSQPIIGSVSLGDPNLPPVTHIYNIPGDYQAILQLWNKYSSVEDIANIQVLKYDLLIADAGGPYKADADVPVLFDGSNSSDPNGDSLLYRWDFNNDGTYDTIWAYNPQTEHTYSERYHGQVKLEVRNGQYTSIDYADVNPFPLVDAGPDLIANTGEEVALQGSFIDDSPTEAWGYEWDFGDGSNQRGTSYSTIPLVNHTYNHPGEYVSTLKVFNGQSEGRDSAKIVVSGTPIEHVAPVADFTATPLSGNLPLGVTFVSQSTGIITDYVWEVDPGFPATTTTDPFYTYTYTNPGTYTVKLTVNGPDGTDTKTKTEYITVGEENKPPLADAGGPYTADAEMPIQFYADNSYDPNGDSLLYRWDFNNDGTYDTTWTDNPQSEHIYTEYYTGMAVVEVSDGTYTSTAYAKVNLLPKVNSGPDQIVYAGVPLTIQGTYTDNTGPDYRQYKWDFGDNSPFIVGTISLDNPNLPQVTHIYIIPGEYIATLTVSNQYGLGQDHAFIKIIPYTNPPLVDAGPDQTANAGEEVTLQGSFIDYSAQETWSYEWDFGDGSYYDGPSYSTIPPVNHTYNQPGEYIATLKVINQYGKGQDTIKIVVMGKPVAITNGPYMAYEGSEVLFDGSASYDPDSGDKIVKYEWDLDNDGIFESYGEKVYKIWNENYSGPVVLRVTDSHGLSSITTTTVSIKNVEPIAAIADSYFIDLPITLLVDGIKGNKFTLQLIQEGIIIAETTLIKENGILKEQAKTITAHIDLSKNLIGKVIFEAGPSGWGANPVWLIIDGKKTLIATFIAMPFLTSTQKQSIQIPLKSLFTAKGKEITFKATASEPGIDVVTLKWNFGDNNQQTTHTYISDGINNITDTITHKYTAKGTYNVTLIAKDEDGVHTYTKTITIF